MEIRHIRTIAKNLGIPPSKLDKLNLIRTIQRTEGNFDCFATAYDGVCDQSDCAWRQDCFTQAKRARNNGG